MSEVETKLSKSMETALFPVLLQLTEIQTSLKKNAGGRDCHGMGMALQEESWAHLEEIAILKDKFMTFAASQRESNIKFHGIDDSQENNTDLIILMGHWLATELSLEPKIFPVITKAYHLGAFWPGRPVPRDIVVSFADQCTKHHIQNLAREKNGLFYKEEKILVFRDLPPEALSVRKALKPTTTKLQLAKIKYCWYTPGKLVVHHNHKPLYAWDEDSGQELFLTLGIDVPMEVEKKSYKRKLAFQTSPNKSSKIPVTPTMLSSTAG